MKVRFQADADLNGIIITATRRLEPLIDFQSAATAKLIGLSDLEVLTIAAREGRILVSHDRRTMQHAFAEFIAHQDSPGLFIVSQRQPVINVADELVLIWLASEAKEWINALRTIPLPK
jgi:hypothetical protein